MGMKSILQRSICLAVCPCDERVDGSLWPIAIVDLDGNTLLPQCALCLGEGDGYWLLQNALCGFVARHRLTGEVVLRCIPDVLGDRRINISQIHERCGWSLLTNDGCRRK